MVSRITNTRLYNMHRMDEPKTASARTRMSWKRTTWSPTTNSQQQTPPSDASFRTSTSHKQSPQSTNVRHSLDFASLRDACLSKLSRSRKRMSYSSYVQHSEMSSPIEMEYSPRLFPLAPMNEYQIPRESSEFTPEAKFEVDESEGSQAIRADIEPIIHTLYEGTTGRYQYVVADPITKEAIIIDPVLDRNPYASGITTTAADEILYLIRENNYHVVRILETHSIQEHPTSAWYLRTQLRDSNGHMPRICTGKAIAGVQRMFARQYQVQDAGWASKFDFFRDGQIFVVGEMKVQCVHLLSQPDWFGFIIGHNIFLGKEVPKDTTQSGQGRPAQRIPMRRLAQFVGRYAFHPQSNEHNISRPSTAQSEVSQWMHDAVLPRHETAASPHEAMAARREPVSPQSPRSPRGSNGMARMRRIMGRQNTNTSDDWNSVSSRASSRQSHRRISHLTELA